jgi:hypothetical protein
MQSFPVISSKGRKTDGHSFAPRRESTIMIATVEAWDGGLHVCERAEALLKVLCTGISSCTLKYPVSGKP